MTEAKLIWCMRRQAMAVLVLVGFVSTAALASEHAVGRVPMDTGCYRIVVEDEVIEPEQPVVPGEHFVLSTVGAVDFCGDAEEFHPLASYLVDRTFPEAPRDEWLAMWNLGRKSPGWLSRMRAAFPMFLAKKRARKRELRGLEKRIEKLEAADGRIDKGIPRPYLHVNDKHRRSKIGLVLSSIKRGLGFGLRRSGLDHLAFPVQIFYRNYLLRARDLQQREFAHGYLGLMWYDDLTRGGEDPALDPDWVEEIKFRMLSDRHIFGSWVDNEERPHMVHGFESEMRDHLWGTSCYLASIANLYHLGYEEFHRYTATDVPLALGGILYYDPKLAPESSQVKWSVFNPFDLTYNPFRNREVQRAAEDGRRVPLAIYVYQSNLALKPIIAVDFFRPDNPRVREAASYWRKLGNEAVSSLGGIGLLYDVLRRTAGFAANRKELTWFTDNKLALGLEELRLSLISHLYFEPEQADKLLDALERSLINPLVQPGKVQRLRAEYQYLLLQADDGEKLIRLGRRLREQRVRRSLGLKSKRVTIEDYARYRDRLRQREAARTLRIYLAEAHLSGIPQEELRQAVEVLGRETRLENTQLLDTLQQFRDRVEIESRLRGNRKLARQGRTLLAATDRAMASIYRRSGRNEAHLRADLQDARRRRAEKAAEKLEEQRKDQAGRFTKELKEQLKFLEDFARDDGDLALYSPWYVADALNFFSQVPEILRFNPVARARYAKFESRVETVLGNVRTQLAAAESEDLQWLDAGRRRSLRLVLEAQRQLRERPAATPAGIATASSLQGTQQ